MFTYMNMDGPLTALIKYDVKPGQNTLLKLSQLLWEQHGITPDISQVDRD